MSVDAPRRPGTPVLVYDGDCSFCRRWVRRLERLTGPRVQYEPYQTAASRFPEIPLSEFQRAVRLVEPDGRAWGGSAAAFQALARARGLGWLWGVYCKVPGFARLAELAYRWISERRHLW